MPRNYKPLFAICKALGLDYKDKVAEFTEDRTDSLSSLTDGEFKEFMVQMRQLNPTEFKPKPGDKQRKKMIGIAKDMGKLNPVAAVDEWCRTYGVFKKPLMEHNVVELNQVLHIYEFKVYKSYLSSLNK